MDRVDWLRSRFRCALKNGFKSRPPYRWATDISAPVTETEFAAIWEDEWDDHQQELTKIPPSLDAPTGEGK